MLSKRSIKSKREVKSVNRVRSPRAHGRSATNRGFTVLEILLAVFLFFALASSWLFIRKKHGRVTAQRKCEQKRWGWNAFVEELQMKSTRWQMLASLCLQDPSFSPLRVDKGGITVEDILSYSVVSEAQTAPGALFVLPGHQFARGQAIRVCGHSQSRSASIQDLAVGQTRSKLTLPTEPNSNESLLERGDLVAQVDAVRFEIKEESPGNFFVYKKVQDQLQPIFTQLKKVEFKFDPDAKIIRYGFFASDDCSLEGGFSLRSEATESGKWILDDSGLEFQPWTFPSEGATS